MTLRNKSIIYIHIATLLFGFSAIFGKLINLSTTSLVWHRMWIASLAFLFYPRFIKHLRNTSRADSIRFLIIGILVALHWLAFYGCIKVGNSVSIAFATFGTITIFTSILEPLINKVAFDIKEIFTSVLVLMGLIIVALSFPEDRSDIGPSQINAFILGILSSFFAALFSIYNKKYISDQNPVVLTFFQMLGGFLFLSLIFPLIVNLDISTFELISEDSDWGYILLLVIICTNVAFFLEISALKHISAFVTNLILNLEPIYGILMAFFIFKEHEKFNFQFFLGTIVISLSVFIHPLITKYKYPNKLKFRKKKS